jgi:hypothetical protein
MAGVVGRRALIPLMEGTLRGPPPVNTMGSVDVEGRGVPVRGGIFGRGGVPTYWARRLRTSGVPPTEYGVPAGLPSEPGPLRLLGVPTVAAGEKRGLTILTGRLGLVIVG